MKEKIFDFAYMMAFRDATMRNAFKRFSAEQNDDGMYHERKQRVKAASRGIVKSYIDEILDADIDSPDPIATIIGVCEKMERDGFTFGNAQKLVNMTAKYMFLSSYADKEKRKLFAKCHCPMDGEMS